MNELLQLEAVALALLARDVVTLSDADLEAPTPCVGWNVADLIRHMNDRHEAILTPVLPGKHGRSGSVRDDFAVIAARWVVAMDQAGDTVVLPDRGPFPTEKFMSVHLTDMLVHRWDLNRALDRPCPTPSRLTALALPTARSITGAGSAFNGPGGVYKPAVESGSPHSDLDAIVALLGRDPAWEPKL